MKYALALLIFCSALPLIGIAYGNNNPCPGVCQNEGSNQFFDSTCSAAGMARGERGCNQYINLGCVWHQKQPVTSPGFCQNEGNNRFFDGTCSAAGMARGERGCNQYINLGCVWHPGATTCR
jgi:hypothetical protein